MCSFFFPFFTQYIHQSKYVALVLLWQILPERLTQGKTNNQVMDMCPL